MPAPNSGFVPPTSEDDSRQPASLFSTSSFSTSSLLTSLSSRNSPLSSARNSGPNSGRHGIDVPRRPPPPSPADDATAEPLVASRGRLCLWIPECLMAAFADILHSSTNVQELNAILGVDGAQRFQAENLQSLRKGIETLSLGLHERGYFSGLKFHPRNLRLGPGRGRFATGHHQQVAPLDQSDGGTTHIEPLLLGFGKRFMYALFIDDGSHRSPERVRGRIDDGFHQLLDAGVGLVISRGVTGSGCGSRRRCRCGGGSAGCAAVAASGQVSLHRNPTGLFRRSVGLPRLHAGLRSFLLRKGGRGWHDHSQYCHAQDRRARDRDLPPHVAISLNGARHHSSVRACSK